jgi:saccharopine dehydrogenase-like NADP-dependent oxidoreductase
MSHYSSFAVVGAGTFGKDVLSALLAKNVSVVVLSGSPKDISGVKVEVIDYADSESVKKVLLAHKVEVVISTLGFEGLTFQGKVADGAKAAGVKLFVLSEYGCPTIGHTEEFLGYKDSVARKHFQGIMELLLIFLVRICQLHWASHCQSLCKSFSIWILRRFTLS